MKCLIPRCLTCFKWQGIAVQSKDRTDEDPVIAAGGPCAFNPEPLADFIDLFLIGDGEDLLPEILKLHERCRGRRPEQDTVP